MARRGSGSMVGFATVGLPAEKAANPESAEGAESGANGGAETGPPNCTAGAVSRASTGGCQGAGAGGVVRHWSVSVAAALRAPLKAPPIPAGRGRRLLDRERLTRPADRLVPAPVGGQHHGGVGQGHLGDGAALDVAAQLHPDAVAGWRAG